MVIRWTGVFLVGFSGCRWARTAGDYFNRDGRLMTRTSNVRRLSELTTCSHIQPMPLICTMTSCRCLITSLIDFVLHFKLPFKKRSSTISKGVNSIYNTNERGLNCKENLRHVQKNSGRLQLWRWQMFQLYKTLSIHLKNSHSYLASWEVRGKQTNEGSPGCVFL